VWLPDVVSIGRAIVREPRIFLMDEPLSNLDAKLRVAMRAEISKLHKRLETTFVYVTHDQMEAMTMATRIAVMKNGLIHQLDTPQHLYDHPQNVFVAGFIGSPAMNFFNGRVVRSDGGLVIEAGTIRVPVPESRVAQYSPYAGKDVILGIRPEDVHNPAFVPSGIHAAPVEGRVDVSELMGNEVFLYMVAGETTFVGRVDPRTQARMGDRMQVMFNMDNMHLFDPQGDQPALQ